MGTTQRTRSQNGWVNVPNVSPQSIRRLHDRFPLLDERDLRDVLPPQQRPKFVTRDTYQFLVLLFPVFHRDRHAIATEEVDLFLFDHTVISIHTDRIPVFRELDAAHRKGRADHTPTAATMVLEILERLLDYCGPILVHLQNDINEQEGRVSDHFEEHAIISTALLRRNVVAFRRAFTPNLHVIDHLRASGDWTRDRGTRTRLDRLYDKADEIVALLEDFTSAISHIHETQQALVTHRTNRSMTALTVIAVLTFPIAMLASILGIGAMGTPLVGRPFGFWLIITAFVTIAASMLAIFKWRRWF